LICKLAVGSKLFTYADLGLMLSTVALNQRDAIPLFLSIFLPLILRDPGFAGLRSDHPCLGPFFVVILTAAAEQPFSPSLHQIADYAIVQPSTLPRLSLSPFSGASP